MSSLNNFSVFTEVYAYQLSNTKVRNLIYMKIKMIYNGKKCKNMEDCNTL